MEPPQLYYVFLELDNTWIFMQECPYCFALIPADHIPIYEHSCPDNPEDLGRNNIELGFLLHQAKVFMKIRTVLTAAPCA